MMLGNLKGSSMSRYMICFLICITDITIGTDIYLPEIFSPLGGYFVLIVTEHDFLCFEPYAGQAREHSPFFLSIHV